MMNKFKELRKSKHLTQEELVEQFNNRYGKQYTASSISMFESGKRIPETQSLIDFADFFEVSIDYLLGHDVKHNVVSGIVSGEEAHVAANIKSLRIQNNLTQEELAERLEIRQQTIGKWESAITVPRLPMLKKIGNFFGVSADYLLGQKQESFSRPMSVLEQAEKELDEDDLRQLEALAKHFLKKKNTHV